MGGWGLCGPVGTVEICHRNPGMRGPSCASSSCALPRVEKIGYNTGRILSWNTGNHSVGEYISELQRRLQDCRAAGTPLPLWLLQMMTSSLIINLRLPQGNQEVEETLVSILTFSTPEDIERCTFNIMVMAGLVEAI